MIDRSIDQKGVAAEAIGSQLKHLLRPHAKLHPELKLPFLTQSCVPASALLGNVS